MTSVESRVAAADARTQSESSVRDSSSDIQVDAIQTNDEEERCQRTALKDTVIQRKGVGDASNSPHLCVGTSVLQHRGSNQVGREPETLQRVNQVQPIK